MAQLHDTGYKFLFSHADLVRELLEVFAPPGLTELLDYDTLQPVPGSFITPAMKKREDDVVWSIELRGGLSGQCPQHPQRLYLYLLLEFQSSIDRGMPVRMMQYVSALYDHLIRARRIDLADGLPPVLPIVLYNGDTRWTHSPELLDLIQPHPAVLAPYQPRLKFWLLDEQEFSADYLDGLQRVMAAIFRMEHAADTAAVKESIRYLGKAVAASPFKQRIDRAVMQWMQYRLNHKIPGLPELPLEDLLKGSDMLETNIDRILDKARVEGMQIGKLEGMQIGEERGMQIGEHRGRLEGKLEGETQLLERLIVRRFGPLTDATRARLRAATAEQLEHWAERILDAATLADIFDRH